MTNSIDPFDDDDRRYLVLANALGQHSLWPTAIAVPGGWSVVHEEDGRQGCLRYVTNNWTEPRPTRREDGVSP
jgi:MbtH protein